jgi:hypothetical protein
MKGKWEKWKEKATESKPRDFVCLALCEKDMVLPCSGTPVPWKLCVRNRKIGFDKLPFFDPLNPINLLTEKVFELLGILSGFV